MSVLAFITDKLLLISGIMAIGACILIFWAKMRAAGALEKKVQVLGKERDRLTEQQNHEGAKEKSNQITSTRKSYANWVKLAEVASIVLIALGVAAQTVDSIVGKKQMTEQTSKADSQQQELKKLLEATKTEIQASIGALEKTVNTKISLLDARVKELETKVDALSKGKGGGGPGKPPKGKDGDGDQPSGPRPGGGGNAASLSEEEKHSIEQRLNSLSLRIDALETEPSFEVQPVT